MVLGPGGLYPREVYPDQPPSRATIHAYQARLAGSCGLFSVAVRPCSLALAAQRRHSLRHRGHRLPGAPSRASTSCIRHRRDQADHRQLDEPPHLGELQLLGLTAADFSVRNTCSMVQRSRYHPTIRQPRPASSPRAWSAIASATPSRAGGSISMDIDNARNRRGNSAAVAGRPSRLRRSAEPDDLARRPEVCPGATRSPRGPLTGGHRWWQTAAPPRPAPGPAPHGSADARSLAAAPNWS